MVHKRTVYTQVCPWLALRRLHICCGSHCKEHLPLWLSPGCLRLSDQGWSLKWSPLSLPRRDRILGPAVTQEQTEYCAWSKLICLSGQVRRIEMRDQRGHKDVLMVWLTHMYWFLSWSYYHLLLHLISSQWIPEHRKRTNVTIKQNRVTLSWIKTSSFFISL